MSLEYWLRGVITILTLDDKMSCIVYPDGIPGMSSASNLRIERDRGIVLLESGRWRHRVGRIMPDTVTDCKFGIRNCLGG